MDKELVKALDNIKDTLYEKVDEKLAVQQRHLDELTSRQKDLRIGGTAPTIISNIDNALVKNLDNLSRLAKGEIKSFQMDVKAVGDMSFTGNFANASNSVAYVRQGIIENANRPLHIRDLIPKGQMTGSNFVYLKENGAGEGSITTVSEGSTKTQIDFDVTEIVVPAEFIAGWLRITSKMLDDTPSMRTFLSNRLLEALLVVEDTQLMTGSGTSPNLKGINTSGNFTAASGSATIDLEQIVEAIAQLATLGRNPDGVILHPNDYWRIVLNKAATSGEYDFPDIVNVSPAGAVTIAGVPVVWTVAQAEDTYTVGDFAHGSALLFREEPRIEFFNQDGTNVRENKITIRIEERVAFAVYGATYFIKGDFGNIA